MDCRFDGFGGGIIEILLESDDFGDVKEGDRIPDLVPIVSTIDEVETLKRTMRDLTFKILNARRDILDQKYEEAYRILYLPDES